MSKGKILIFGNGLDAQVVYSIISGNSFHKLEVPFKSKPFEVIVDAQTIDISHSDKSLNSYESKIAFLPIKIGSFLDRKDNSFKVPEQCLYIEGKIKLVLLENNNVIRLKQPRNSIQTWWKVLEQDFDLCHPNLKYKQKLRIPEQTFIGQWGMKDNETYTLIIPRQTLKANELDIKVSSIGDSISVISLWDELLALTCWQEVYLTHFEIDNIVKPYIKYIYEFSIRQFEASHNSILKFLFSYLMASNQKKVEQVFRTIRKESIKIISRKITNYDKGLSNYFLDKEHNKDIRAWLASFEKKSITTNYWSVHEKMIDEATSIHVNGEVRSQEINEEATEDLLTGIYLDYYVYSGSSSFQKTKDDLWRSEYKTLDSQDKWNYEDIWNRMEEVKNLIRYKKPRIIEIYGLNPYGDQWLFDVLSGFLSKNNLFREKDSKEMNIIIWIYREDRILYPLILEKLKKNFSKHLNNIAFLPTTFFLNEEHLEHIQNNKCDDYWDWAYKKSKYFMEWSNEYVDDNEKKMKTLQEFLISTKKERKNFLLLQEIDDSRMKGKTKTQNKDAHFFNLQSYKIVHKKLYNNLCLMDLNLDENRNLINQSEPWLNDFGIRIPSRESFKTYNELFANQSSGDTILLIIGNDGTLGLYDATSWMTGHNSVTSNVTSLVVKVNTRLWEFPTN